jgi:carboxypeptidase Q
MSIEPLKIFTSVALVLARMTPSTPGESSDRDVLTRIRLEGFHNSKVMETASALIDGIGPRLTGSPNMRKASAWSRKQLEDWGLSNVHLESWGPFGRGWSYEACSVRMVRPDTAQLIALPEAWTAGTEGAISADGIHVIAKRPADLDQFRGKLRGKVVFFGEARELKPHETAESSRFDAEGLARLEQFTVPAKDSDADREASQARGRLNEALAKLLSEERAVAVVYPGRPDFGTLGVLARGSREKGAPRGVASLRMAIEHFGRVARLLDRNQEVALELDVRTRFLEDAPPPENTIAEIPGTDERDEIVMLGAHLDSWHGGTGATDDGAGVVAMMEAVRILKAIDARPRRRIRIALWSGEEQGGLGSRAYVAQHFGSDPSQRKPERARLSAYFNLDSGTGRIRGISAQENGAAVPIFRSWMAPLADLGVTAVTMRNEEDTDHLAFDAVGLPGFQFIQDPIEYETRSQHTNMDVYERLQRDDLMQASVVIAWFVYEAAMRDGLMPRKPMPQHEASEAAR